jgi:hypothetical protein
MWSAAAAGIAAPPSAGTSAASHVDVVVNCRRRASWQPNSRRPRPDCGGRGRLGAPEARDLRFADPMNMFFHALGAPGRCRTVCAPSDEWLSSGQVSRRSVDRRPLFYRTRGRDAGTRNLPVSERFCRLWHGRISPSAGTLAAGLGLRAAARCGTDSARFCRLFSESLSAG